MSINNMSAPQVSMTAKPIQFSFATHSGLVRELNEDATGIEPENALFALCDGVGGQEAGELASALGCASLLSAINAGRSLLESTETAHQAVLDAAITMRDNRAATLVAAQIIGSDLYLVWAGDSPAFLLRQSARQSRQLTTPHSLVAELVQLGKLTESEALEHPLRHTITQSLGIQGRAFCPSNLQLRLRDGDRIVLCSDGVSDVFDVATLWSLAGPDVDIQNAAQKTVDTAVAKSGHDNTTAIVIQYKNNATWFRRLLNR